MAETENIKDIQRAEKMTRLEAFAKAIDGVISLTDLTKTTTKTWTVFSKDTLRSYLQSPYSATSQTQLRNLSRFLYTLSFPLRRLIQYFASLPDFSVYKVIPEYSLVEDNDEEALMQDFENACKFIRGLKLDLNIFRLLVIAWREDLAPFYPLIDDSTGETYLMPLDSQYCKISGIGYNNLYHVAYDFSFFNGSTGAWYLETYPKEFSSLYKKYQSDSTLRWQELEGARAIKLNIDQPDLVLSPLVSLFENIIDICDIQALNSVKTALDAYKLLVMKIPLLDSQTPDDMAVSLNLAKSFYSRLVEELPESVAAVLSPLEISDINFSKDATSTTNEITDAYRNLTESAGVSQIMDASRLTGSSAIKYSMLMDVTMGTKAIVPQVESLVNELLQQKYPNIMAHVKFTNVTEYTKEDRIKTLRDAAANGVPCKLEYASLLGYDPLEVMNMDMFESKLGLGKTAWINPLVSSYTQSPGSETGGAPEKDLGDLTQEGAETKDKEKNKK